MRKILALVALAVTSLACTAGDRTRVVVNSGRGVVPIRSAQPLFLNLNTGHSYHNSNAIRLNLNSGYNVNSQALRLNLSTGYAAPVQPLILNLQQPTYTPAQALFLNLQSGCNNVRGLNGGCNKSTPVVPVVPGIVP